jgi:pimeloyl-ACP methyl ester carboxylesterase
MHDVYTPAIRNAAILVACTAAFYWVMLSPMIAMSGLYNKILFIPNRTAPVLKEINSLPIQEVTFKSLKGATLHGWYIHNPNAKKTMLFSHGNGGNLMVFVPTIQAALMAGASVFAYDYQGYGKSGGAPTLDGVVEDAEAAYDYLVKELHVAPRNIILFGQSLGTGVSAELSKRRECAAIILLSPFTNIINVAREHLLWLSFYPRASFPSQILNTQEVLSARTHPKTLIIHGELDQTVPVHHARDLQQCCSQPMEVVFIPNAGHNDLLYVAPTQVIATMHQFVQ